MKSAEVDKICSIRCIIVLVKIGKFEAKIGINLYKLVKKEG